MIGAGLRAEIGTKSRVTATLRFVITISTALLLSGLFHSPQLGGFAALGAFMALLSDTESDLISRLGGVAITFVGVMCAALLGVVLKNMEYGKWLVIALVCFGQNLVTFAEKFWWLWGKYVLVFLLISIFDFTPDLMAFVGYFVVLAWRWLPSCSITSFGDTRNCRFDQWLSSNSSKAATATLTPTRSFPRLL